MDNEITIGQYVLVRKIGEGGMAEVWEADHVHLHNRAALKFLLPRFAGDPELEERFLNEGKRQAQLQHPNIVSAIDFFQLDGHSYLVMHFVDGVSLETRLQTQRGPLPLDEVHAISWDTLSALDYAHANGVVHRDVKPSNILIDATGRVFLTDFGIALALSEERRVTRTGSAIGTPDYMSPEQILRPKQVDSRSDIYSFGCVLYAMLTGGPPFGAEGATEFSIKDCHVRNAPPPIRDRNRYVTPALERVVFTCLEKDPERRFQNGAAIMAAFDAALQSRQTSDPRLARQTPLPLREETVLEQPAVAAAPYGFPPPANYATPAGYQTPTNYPPPSGYQAPSGYQTPPAYPTPSNYATPAGYRTPPPYPTPSGYPAPPTYATPAGLPVAPPPPPPPVSPPSQPAFMAPVPPPPQQKKRLPVWLIALLALLLLCILGGAAYYLFGGKQTTVASVPATDPVLKLEGSTTIGDELAPKLMLAFLRHENATDIKGPVPGKEKQQVLITATLAGESEPKVFSVVANGSGNAFTALQAQGADIGMASRPIKPAEAAKLRQFNIGDMTSPESETIVGLDGIAVVVNSGNRVEQLDKTQVAKIFQGTITDWSQVGGSPGPIHVYGRDTKSGTFDSFVALVLGGKKETLSPSITVEPNGDEISKVIATDSGGIGYVGIAQIKSSKALAISDGPATAALFPTPFTVATEDYILSRRLFLYTPEHASPLARAFVNFASSPEGQAVVKQVGYVEQTGDFDTNVTIAPNAPLAYRELTANRQRMRINFRFRSGSNSLDNKALQDIGRALDSLTKLDIHEVELFGFADSQAGADNLALSRERADVVADQFSRRGVKTEVQGFSSQMPVADNRTPEGRARNRRVEVWAYVPNTLPTH